MAAVPPISPPFYMTKAGALPRFITLLDGDGGVAQYNVAVAMGYRFMATTAEPPVNAAQPLATVHPT